MTKKSRFQYDDNGHWVEEKTQIKGAIRKAFRRFPQVSETLSEARIELPPKLKKDGTPGKKPVVRYKCAMCQELFSQKFVQVDHIDPVVPLHTTEAKMSYDDLVKRICCPKNNLQVLCSTPLKLNNNNPSCHKIKTDEENFIRDALKKGWQGDLEQNILKLKNDYKLFLEQKVKLKAEKEERKRIREEKRLAKLKKV